VVAKDSRDRGSKRARNEEPVEPSHGDDAGHSEEPNHPEEIAPIEEDEVELDEEFEEEAIPDPD
jgi:hypothetical protein